MRSNSNLILACIYGFFILIELFNAWRSRSNRVLRVLIDKDMIWFWLSVSFFLTSIFYQIAIRDDSVFSMIVTCVLNFSFTFPLLAYLLFRGTLVVFNVSGEGNQHPTCLAIRKLTQRKLLTYCLLFGMTLFSHAGYIYVMLVFYRMGR